MNKILLKFKSKLVYGRELWYPQCPKGHALAKLIRPERGITIPPRTKSLLEAAGYEIEIETFIQQT